MEDALRARVVGQDHVVTAVADAVRTSRAGLQNPSRPVASFLMLGATGTGKTEICKALASFLFNDEHKGLWVILIYVQICPWVDLMISPL
jgi:ATP-dependent Clp protease ATP-binding subunit ClpB